MTKRRKRINKFNGRSQKLDKHRHAKRANTNDEKNQMKKTTPIH
jgi:hypothetical protein